MSKQGLLAIQAQAEMHHAFLLGLQLMVSTSKGPDVMGDWMFRLFRRQHHEKFLSSFEKLGLENLPDAVACAQYHVMSNSVGGVPVEYMAESDTKAWVRFRYPRWMYHGPTICGIPVSVSRGFLEGWYAQNGVSLENPRLGFVCVSEDMTGEFGLCGYFREFESDLSDEERLQFARGELPPSFRAEDQPVLPSGQWGDERRQKANRNYAMDYIRNGLVELAEVIGRDLATELGGKAAYLIGLQYFDQTRRLVNTEDGDIESALAYLAAMFVGMGDEVETDSDSGSVVQRGLRIVRGIDGIERELLLNVWTNLWQGALHSYRLIKHADIEVKEEEIIWCIRERMQH
jgi:hypothetical protein